MSIREILEKYMPDPDKWNCDQAEAALTAYVDGRVKRHMKLARAKGYTDGVLAERERLQKGKQ